MPRYSVRMYSSYVDEYEVEAASEEDAIDLADQWECCADPTELARLSAMVTQVTKHEYVDHYDTMVNELDDNGQWLEST